MNTMGRFEDMANELDSTGKKELIGILKNSVASEEMAALEGQLQVAKSVPERVAIKQKIHDLTSK